MDGCPLGLGLVVEDKPTEFSCNYSVTCACASRHVSCTNTLAAGCSGIVNST